MKRKISIYTFIIILMFSLIFITGCGNQKENSESNINNENNVINEEKSEEEIYMQILSGERKYIKENNQEELLQEYIDTLNSNNVYINYAMIDLDEDDKNEMVIYIDTNSDGYYLVLNYESGAVYGFKFDYREMVNLKIDGRFMQSGGAADSQIVRMVFDKNEININILAIRNSNEFKINSEVVTEKDYNEYMSEFEKMKNVEFSTYNEESTYIDKDKNSDKKITGKYVVSFDEPELIQEYGNSVNIEFDDDGTVIYTNVYFDQTKTGIYTIDSDTIKINYSYEKVFDQSLDKMIEKNISEEEYFTIENDKEIIQTSTGYKFLLQ